MTESSTTSTASAPLPKEQVAPLLPATAPAPEPARKVNFFKALFLFWLLPRRYGPHLAAGSFRRALLAHVLSILLAAILLLAGSFYKDVSRGMQELGSLRALLAAAVLEMAAETTRAGVSWLPLAIALGTVPAAELLMVLLAIFVMPWCAGGDRAGSVFKRSLKNTWWCTTILIPVAAVWTPFILLGDRIDEWLKGNENLLLLGLFVLTPLIPVVLLIRMLTAGAGRYVGKPDGPAFHPREPRCDDCGYLIVALPLDLKCPECGLPVRESLPGGRRKPTAWEQHELQARGFLELLRMQWRVLRQPDFFHRLPVHSGISAARHFWWGTYILVVFTMMAVLEVTFLLLTGGDWRTDSMVLEATMFGAVVAPTAPLVLQSLMMFAGCLYAQWALGARDYRASATVCYYASPMMWPAMGLTLLFPVLALRSVMDYFDELLPPFHEILYIDGSVLVGAVLLLLVLVTLILWWLRLCRALRSTQHANV